MAIGNITQSILGSRQIESDATDSYAIVHHSSDLYVLSWYDLTNGAGYVGTIRISDDGLTFSTVIDVWTYFAGTWVGEALVKVGENRFMLMAHTSNGAEASTFYIDNSGIITKSKTSTLVLAAGAGTYPYWPRVINIAGTEYYAFSYRCNSPNNDFRVHSVHVNPLTGVITDIGYTSAGASTLGTMSALTELPNGMIVSVNFGASQEGHIRTLQINKTTGVLGAFLADTTGMAGSNLFYNPSIVPVYENSDMVVFSYRGSGEDGYLQTARVNTTTGAITLLHNFEFDTVIGYNPEIQKISHHGDIIVGYNGNSIAHPNVEGILRTFTINPQGTIAYNTASYSMYNMGADEWARVGYGNGRWIPIGELNSGIFAIFRAYTTGDRGIISTIEIPNADIRPTGSQSTRMFAPVDAVPALTSGRNASGYATGHEPKYTLDNDPDTYWKPNVYTTSSIYYDLGGAVSVDALVMWLHNYNENYHNSKSWCVYYSSDDATYYPITTKAFSTYRTEYTPLVVDEFFTPIAARYWKVEFLYFGSSPITHYPEISCVWFMNDYSLPYKHQLPENNSYLYHNNGTTTRSKHRFSSNAGVGKQRVLQRRFTFTDADSYAVLYNAHKAAHGGNLPIVMQTELESNAYYAVQFDSPLQIGKQEYGSWSPQVTLRELGHERIPMTSRLLTATPTTVGLWHFRQNGDDDSVKGNDLSASGVVVGDYVYGITEQGYTAGSFIAPKYLYRAVAGATDFDFGTSSFTIETWMRYDSVATSTLAYKIQGSPIVSGWRISYYASGGVMYRRVELGDGVHEAVVTSPAISGLYEWHYFATVVDRVADTITMYRDGVLLDGPDDISAITGNISANTGELIVKADVAGTALDELCISREAMTAAMIATRYAGVANYGTWGM
jgi:hypothetical protein